jgi:hypothetical protein
MAKKLGKTIEIIGLLTILGTAAAKLAPLLKNTDPKVKKKFESIIKLLIELKEEVFDLGTLAKKEFNKKTKK